jgi:transposase-like protein
MKSARKYDKEFKLNAIKLFQESNKSHKEIADNLGIPSSTLYTWIQEHKVNGNSGFQGSGIVKPSNEELYQLKKQLADVTMERDILKKAVAIFSRPKG